MYQFWAEPVGIVTQRTGACLEGPLKNSALCGVAGFEERIKEQTLFPG